MVTPVMASGAARRFVRADLWCEYDFDPQAVPLSVLSIPAVASVLPLSWAEDLAVNVHSLDAVYADVVPVMKAAWSGLLPDRDLSGEFQVSVRESLETPLAEDRSLVMFSGGIDSLVTALRHRDAAVTLCSIWGLDVPLENRAAWTRTFGLIREFATAHGLETATIRTNVKRFLDGPRLGRRYGAYFGNWWQGSTGLALPAMAAPVAWLQGAYRVLVASSVHEGSPAPFGTCPEIDETVRFFGVGCTHDSYEMSRAAKIAYLAEADPGRRVLVCNSGAAVDGSNCGRCKKCVRTALGYHALGLDPVDHGLVVPDASIRAVRERMATGRSRLSPHFSFLWRGLQSSVPEVIDTPSPAADEFLEWLRTFDLATIDASRPEANSTGFRGVLGRLVPYWMQPLARRLYLRLFKHW